MAELRLAVKKQYFDEIKSGVKTYEFRLYNDYWCKRLIGKTFSKIVITLGYPKAGDPEREIVRPFQGFEVQNITHEHFGPLEVKVFALLVNGEYDYMPYDDKSECWNCGGSGEIEGDCTCMEDSCACLEPEPPQCSLCEGTGVL